MHRSLKNKSFAIIFRYLIGQILSGILKSSMCFYPIRAWLLNLFGSNIGSNSRFCRLSFFNYYSNGFSNFEAGDNVYIGEETMIDLADKVVIGSNTTLAERVMVLTHTNVGYKDHPLKREFPDTYLSVTIGDGVFIGANALLMPGIKVGNGSVVGAKSLVLKDVEPNTVVAGVPAKFIRRIG